MDQRTLPVHAIFNLIDLNRMHNMPGFTSSCDLRVERTTLKEQMPRLQWYLVYNTPCNDPKSDPNPITS